MLGHACTATQLELLFTIARHRADIGHSVSTPVNTRCHGGVCSSTRLHTKNVGLPEAQAFSN